MKRISKSICSVSLVAMLLLLGACGNTAPATTTASASGKQVASASVADKQDTTSVSTDDKKDDTTASAEKEPEPKSEITESVFYGEKRDDLRYVVITINPEILVGVNADGKVEYVENLNDDGADVLTAVITTADAENFASVEKFMNAYLNTVVDKGYGDKENFTITVQPSDEGVKSEEFVNEVAESLAKAIPEDKLEAENVKFIVGEEVKEEVWVVCPDCEYGIAVCPKCKGNWQTGGVVSDEKTCENCGGSGYVVVSDSHTVLVYNGTPCRVCGDVGTVDDGKHGGKRAICGECIGYGTSHSVGDQAPQAYGYSGVYAGYAFDEKVITNEHNEICASCNGTGKTGSTHTEPCKYCSYGTILCPTCNGAGGHFE